MAISAFLPHLAILLTAMAALAVAETVVPLSRKRAWRRRHLLPNLQLAAVTLGLNFAANAGAVLVTSWLAMRDFGLLAGTSLSPLLMTAFGLVVLDASTYLCHRSMHRFVPLWRAHRVHHADPLVDVTTSLRQHPIEGMWRFGFVMAPAWLLGVPAEAVALYRVVSALIALTEHMDVKLWEPLDGALSFVFCTPNMHKVHHSRLAIETDSNYGNIFSIFDRLAGTFTPPASARDVDYGLAGFDEIESQRFGALLRLPFEQASAGGSRSRSQFRRCVEATSAAPRKSDGARSAPRARARRGLERQLRSIEQVARGARDQDVAGTGERRDARAAFAAPSGPITRRAPSSICTSSEPEIV